MKNATRYCADPAYYRMCSTDVYCSKQTGSSSTKETITIISSFLELGRRKLSMQPKFVAALAENVVKTETQQTFVNGLLRFYYFRHLYSAGSACVLLLAYILFRVAHRYGQLYLPHSLIYFWVPSSCFCISSQPLSEVEIIPFSGVCQSGEAALSTPEAVVAALADGTALITQPTTTSGNIITQSIIFSWHQLTPSCIFASSAATSR